jgi:hypothetical protein
VSSAADQAALSLKPNPEQLRGSTPAATPRQVDYARRRVVATTSRGSESEAAGSQVAFCGVAGDRRWDVGFLGGVEGGDLLVVVVRASLAYSAGGERTWRMEWSER